MKPFNLRMDSSVHSHDITQKKQSQQRINQIQGLFSETDRTHQIRSKSRKSEALTEQRKIPSLNQIHAPISQYAETYYQRQSYSSGNEYFEEPGMSASQHQYSIDKVNINPHSLLNSKQSIDYNSNSKMSQTLEGELRRMKCIIIQKDKCIRDITERLRIIMQQLERYQIQSQANQCFTRLMSDLSRMFQIPDISIQDIRIQTSILLEQRKIKEHTMMINERKNVEEIQQLINKLNNEVTNKNILEIKLVDISNQNIVLKTTVETLTLTNNQQNIQIKQIFQQMLSIKQELQESNKMRKSGSETMGNQNRLLKIQHDKMLRERDELEIELKEVQQRLLECQGATVENESKYGSQMRKREFQEQQLRKQLGVCMGVKERLTKQNDEIVGECQRIESERGEMERVNMQLRRQIQKSIEQKNLLQQQLNQTIMSKEQIKSTLLTQQQKSNSEYQTFITTYRLQITQLQLRIKQIIQTQKTRNNQLIQYKLLTQRLQTELNQKSKHIQDLNNSKSNISQSKIHIDQKLNITMRQMQQMKQSKESEIDQKSKQLQQIMLSYEQIQRELRGKESEVESMKRSYNSQSQSLDKVKKNLMGEFTKEHELRLELEQELRLKHNQIMEYQNRIEILERQNSGNMVSSQRLDSMIKGEIDARIEAERTKSLSQQNIQKERIQFEERRSQEHLKMISLGRQVDDLQMTINQLEYKLAENQQLVHFLKSQLEQKDKYTRELRDSYNTGGREYEKLSLELSTSQKDIFVSKEIEYQKKMEEISSFVLELQNTLKSKESIIEKLNFQLESMGASNNFRREESLNFSHQDLVNLGASVEGEREIINIKNSSEENVAEKDFEYQKAMRQKQQSYKSLIAKYQSQINELRKQIIYSQQSNLKGSRASSINSQSKHMAVIQSQHFEIDHQQLLQAQQLKYQQLQQQSNNQINQLKLLHSSTLKDIQSKYKESRDELVKQLKELAQETEIFKVASLTEKIEAEKTIKMLYQEIQSKNIMIINNSQQTSIKNNNQLNQEQLTIVKQNLQAEVNIRKNLQLQIKAYQEAIIQLRKQNLQQQQQFQALKQKNLQSSFTKVNNMNDLFERQKQSLQIIIQNKMLQIKTLQSQNSQLKMQILSLKQPQQAYPRSRSIEYTKQLQQKTITLRQLQLQNSTLTIVIDDMRKQLTKREEKIYQLTKTYKDDRFQLQKQNIELISKIKILEIKIDQLTFQLNSLKEIKSNTLLSGKILGALDIENKLGGSSSNFIANNVPVATHNLISLNNSLLNQTSIDLLNEKNYKMPVKTVVLPPATIISNKQSSSFPKQTIVSSVGVSKPLIVQNQLSDYIQTKQKITYSNQHNSINNSQYTFNLANSNSQTRNTPNSNRHVPTTSSPNLIQSFNPPTPNYTSTKINSLNNINTLNKINTYDRSQNSSRQYKERVSPHQQRVTTIEIKEQTRPYFSQKPSQLIGNNLNTNSIGMRQYYSPGKNYQTSQLSPRTMISTAKSLDKDGKTYNYSKVYDQTIKTKQLGPPITQIYDNNKYFTTTTAHQPSNVSQSSLQQPTNKQLLPQTPTTQPYSFNVIPNNYQATSTKINLKQFASGGSQKYSEYFANSKIKTNKQESYAGVQKRVVAPNFEKGIAMYQTEANGKLDSCC